MTRNIASGQTQGCVAGSKTFVRRNYLLGVVNGTLGRLGEGFIEPHLVLAAFVYERTESALWVGLLVSLGYAGILWPQLFMSSLIEHRSRKKPFYVGASVVRVVMLLAMIITILFAGLLESWWMLATFFFAFFAFRSAQGAGVMPFLDIVGQTIPPNRLGGFFALRSLFGDSLALLAGFMVVQPIIGHVASPTCYALLTAFALVFMGGGWGMWSFAHENENYNPPPKRNLREMVIEGIRMVKQDANYQHLLLIRVLVRVNVLALVFYVPYGIERLGAVGLSGVLLGVISASRVTSSLLWGKVSDRKGNRLCLTLGGLFFALSAVAALLAPRVPQLFRWMAPGLAVEMDLRLCVYLFSLCLFGIAFQANMIGSNAFLIESAPSERRPSYIAFLNTLAFPLTLLPAAVGLIVGDAPLGLDVVFAVVVVSGLLTFFSALRLTEVRKFPPKRI